MIANTINDYRNNKISGDCDYELSISEENRTRTKNRMSMSTVAWAMSTLRQWKKTITARWWECLVGRVRVRAVPNMIAFSSLCEKAELNSPISQRTHRVKTLWRAKMALTRNCVSFTKCTVFKSITLYEAPHTKVHRLIPNQSLHK